jgi:hypothetical protein
MKAQEAVVATFQGRAGGKLSEDGFFAVRRSWKGKLGRGTTFLYHLGREKEPGDPFPKRGDAFVLFMNPSTPPLPRAEPYFQASGCYPLSPIEFRRRFATGLRERQIVFTLDELRDDASQ